MMPDNQNPYVVVNNAKEEMVRKSPQIDATQVILSPRERFRAVRRVQHEIPKLTVKLLCKFHVAGALLGPVKE